MSIISISMSKIDFLVCKINYRLWTKHQGTSEIWMTTSPARGGIIPQAPLK